MSKSRQVNDFSRFNHDVPQRPFLSLTSGLLLGLPWSVPSLFFTIFIAWVPLLLVEEETRDHPNRTILFNYAFVGFLLWNILGTWWITQAQWLGAVLIMLANALVQALVFWSISRVRRSLNIPLLFPFLMIWMGYEYFHESWDLAWPWLNLGNALATAPKLIQWVEYTGARGGTLWIILTNFAIFKMAGCLSKKGVEIHPPHGGRNRSAGFHPCSGLLSDVYQFQGGGRNRYGGPDSAQPGSIHGKIRA